MPAPVTEQAVLTRLQQIDAIVLHLRQARRQAERRDIDRSTVFLRRAMNEMVLVLGDDDSAVATP
jgi:hypothetical protein